MFATDKTGKFVGKAEYSKSNDSYKKKDKSNVQCYRCDRYGHYANEYLTKNKTKSKESRPEANIAKDDSDSDSEHVIFSMFATDMDTESKEDSVTVNNVDTKS